MGVSATPPASGSKSAAGKLVLAMPQLAPTVFAINYNKFSTFSKTIRTQKHTNRDVNTHI
jgi:hypothetical protein